MTNRELLQTKVTSDPKERGGAGSAGRVVTRREQAVLGTRTSFKENKCLGNPFSKMGERFLEGNEGSGKDYTATARTLLHVTTMQHQDKRR